MISYKKLYKSQKMTQIKKNVTDFPQIRKFLWHVKNPDIRYATKM